MWAVSTNSLIHTRFVSIKFQLNNDKWKQFKCKWFTYLPTYRRRRLAAKQLFFIIICWHFFVCKSLAVDDCQLKSYCANMKRISQLQQAWWRWCNESESFAFNGAFKWWRQKLFFIPIARSCLTEFSRFYWLAHYCCVIIFLNQKLFNGKLFDKLRWQFTLNNSLLID